MSIHPAEDSLTRPGGGERRHFPFLDGLRGLAALYVVCHHLLAWSAEGVSRPLVLAVSWSNFGHLAVCVFIVLSGLSLMLPVAASPDRSLRGGWGNYLKRRAKRIMPPYYAALVLCLSVTTAIALLRGRPLASLPDLSPGSLITHLLLIFNWFPAWSGTINVAMWSIATEWQIYFFFPLLLLPIWRRFGAAACVVVAALVGLLPHFLLPPANNLDQAFPWFLALFAMGMTVAAWQGRGNQYLAARSRHWLIGLAVFGLIYVGLKIRLSGETYEWTRDLCAGAMTACFLAWCFAVINRPRLPLLLRLLESKVCVILGSFSYSLYLTHIAVFDLSYYLAEILHLTPNVALILRGVIGIPVCLGVAYLFYWFFERPFMAKNATLKAHLAAAEKARS